MTNTKQTQPPPIVIYWAGRRFEFQTAAEARAAGFDLNLIVEEKGR